jgi:serine/threonine protein kinase
MELYDCSLRQWLSKYKKTINISYKIIHDILCGLIEIQDRNLSHSDLKPGNVLIQLEPFKIVLADLGFVSIAKYSKQQRCAPNYRDIDVVNDQRHDMYSFGLIFMELLYNIKPVVYYNYQDIISVVDQHVNNKIHNKLVKNLINENRDKRPLAREVLQILSATCPKNSIKMFNEYPYPFKFYKHHYGQYKDQYDILPLIKKGCKQLNIKRGIRGYQALLMYLCEKNEHRHINHYVAGLLIILSSVFSQKTPSVTSIINLCDLENQSHNKIITIITKLTQHDLFLKCLFS